MSHLSQKGRTLSARPGRRPEKPREGRKPRLGRMADMPSRHGFPWTPEEDAVLLAGVPLEGCSKGLAARLGRSQGSLKSRLEQIGAGDRPIPVRSPVAVARAASEAGLAALGRTPPPDTLAHRREPVSATEERRRARCRQLARDLFDRKGWCWQWLLCAGAAGWTPGALEAVLAEGGGWFAQEGGSVRLQDAGRRELLGLEPVAGAAGAGGGSRAAAG